ncbi:MAG: hypothetical protein SFU25_09620 [Candidatus Caenarcaniphilales bacterium]|nr:hypothetical protein [Candidatus Caenarcaniphilales bacterium]
MIKVFDRINHFPHFHSSNQRRLNSKQNISSPQTQNETDKSNETDWFLIAASFLGLLLTGSVGYLNYRGRDTVHRAHTENLRNKLTNEGIDLSAHEEEFQLFSKATREQPSLNEPAKVIRNNFHYTIFGFKALLNNLFNRKESTDSATLEQILPSANCRRQIKDLGWGVETDEEIGKSKVFVATPRETKELWATFLGTSPLEARRQELEELFKHDWDDDDYFYHHD